MNETNIFMKAIRHCLKGSVLGGVTVSVAIASYPAFAEEGKGKDVMEMEEEWPELIVAPLTEKPTIEVAPAPDERAANHSVF